MRRFYRNIIILIFPFLIMIFINEAMRSSVKEAPYYFHNIATINSAEKLKNKCTWHCHNDTNFCKQYHVKHTQHLFKIIDPIYFGIIGFLKSTGSYAMANILFLVILFPLLMYYFLVKIIHLQKQINSIKK